MRVIPPSFEIMDHLDTVSLALRIEECGRICYKSEEKISDESAEPFVRNIIKRGHNSVTEMAVVTLQVEVDTDNLLRQFYACQPKFIQIDETGKNQLLITASIRGFRELYSENGTVKLIKALTTFLAEKYPLFFEDLAPSHGWVPQAGVIVQELDLDQVNALPADLLAKHRHIAVKFFTNRAVTHEIVRHRPCSFLQESQRYCRYSEDKFGSEITFIKPMFFDEGSDEYMVWEEAMKETERLYFKLLETASPQAARTVLPNSCKTEIIVYANLLEWAHIFRLRTSQGAEPSMREIMNPLQEEFRERFPSVIQ